MVQSTSQALPSGRICSVNFKLNSHVNNNQSVKIIIKWLVIKRFLCFPIPSIALVSWVLCCKHSSGLVLPPSFLIFCKLVKHLHTIQLSLICQFFTYSHNLKLFCTSLYILRIPFSSLIQRVAMYDSFIHSRVFHTFLFQ